MQSTSLITRGIVRGALAGAMVAIVYTLIAIPAVGILHVASNVPVSKTFDALIGVGVFAICAGPFAIVLGILPAVAFGAVGGCLLGTIITHVHTKLTKRQSVFMGVGLA
jgi:hypothetical protein